jgi:glycine/D-amino acid oxidase-like deaminating enzyme
VEDNAFAKGHNPFGTGRVREAAYVDTIVFTQAAKKYIQEKEEWYNETFDYALFNPDALEYRAHKFTGVIFCEGYLSDANPLFQELPVQYTKGETLTIYCPDLQTQESLNRKCFVLPIGNDMYRIGATYTWNTPNDDRTPEARSELIEKFRVVCDLPFEIVDQHAGIRPTTPDRRPILGEHLQFRNVYIFNGLGTKGYMSAPLLAKELCDHILEGTSLNPEVQLTRFKKR